MEVFLASPRGFCAGVERAVRIVERALEVHGSPIYVRHEIVHNRHVVENLRNRGVRFVEELDEVPDAAVVIFSAHGVPRSVRAEGERRDLRVIDATCPLVTKVHRATQRHAREGRELILIGHAGHPEVIGTMGQIDRPMHLVARVEDVKDLAIEDPNSVAFVTQTTLSVDETADIVDALRRRFPNIVGPPQEDTCYATRNRQKAVAAIAEKIDLLLVVGAANSSNSNRLRELGERKGIPSHLVNSADELEDAWLLNVTRVGITAGASAPEYLVQEIVDRLRAAAPSLSVVEEPVTREHIRFNLPI